MPLSEDNTACTNILT